MLFEVSGTRGARELRASWVLILRFVEGRLIEVWSVARDQAAADAFWG